MEPTALEAIIEYIYNPESLVITEENVQVNKLSIGNVRYRGVVAVTVAGNR